MFFKLGDQCKDIVVRLSLGFTTIITVNLTNLDIVLLVSDMAHSVHDLRIITEVAQVLGGSGGHVELS